MYSPSCHCRQKKSLVQLNEDFLYRINSNYPPIGGTVTVKVLLTDEPAGLNAEVFAWMVIAPAAAVPVVENVNVICDPLLKVTESNVKVVAPAFTVKSLI
jgi:hypothetical protein